MSEYEELRIVTTQTIKVVCESFIWYITAKTTFNEAKLTT